MLTRVQTQERLLDELLAGEDAVPLSQQDLFGHVPVHILCSRMVQHGQGFIYIIVRRIPRIIDSGVGRAVQPRIRFRRMCEAGHGEVGSMAAFLLDGWRESLCDMVENVKTKTLA